MAGALSGLVIADFSRVLAGPYATMMLADLGAEVVKVERPGSGDDTRSWGPPWFDGESTYFLSVNRNKRSITLDLHDSEDQNAARRLIQSSDVVVENFKPGTFDRLGLGYEALSQTNPRLVYCSITGFGAGEGAALPGYDLLVQAVGGLMSVTGSASSGPVKVGVALVDVLTGLHATVGILSALHYRNATGIGQRIEVNLLSSLLSGMVNQTGGFAAAGSVPTAMGNAHPSIAPYDVFPTADIPVVIAVGNDAQFAACVGVIGAGGLATDARFATNPARVANRDELANVMSERLRLRSAETWVPLMSAVGVPCGPINDVGGAVQLARELGLNPVVNVEGIPVVANPIMLSDTPVQYLHRPPSAGQDNAWIAQSPMGNSSDTEAG